MPVRGSIRVLLAEQINFFSILILLSFNSHLLAYNIDSAKIVFYYGPKFKDHQAYDLDKAASILNHPKFIHNQTHCYMHGYNVSQESFNVYLMVESYLKRNSINLLTIDWKLLASGSYISAQENVLSLTPIVADSILKLFAAGVDKDTFNLVGHSLGGLAVGLIGREVFQQSHGHVLLPRISILDPSNAAAHEVFILPPVLKTDAKFVDVIHTDAGKNGSPERMGHVNFWPNGGRAIQPGCPALGVNDKCSHRKAWAYWAESIVNQDEEIFWSFHAKNYNDFLENGAEHLNDIAVPMGFNCPTSARGDYYLQLDSEYGSMPDVGLIS